MFAFVALWHDARPKLFVWGLVNFVLVGLERVVGVEARARRVVERAGPPAWDTVGVCALGAGNIVLMIGGNVVGYAVCDGGATTYNLPPRICTCAHSRCAQRGCTAARRPSGA